jgi:hypothetical protein
VEHEKNFLFFEAPKTVTKGGEGEWEPRISFEIFGRCSKITIKHN